MNDLQIFENPEFGQVRTVEIDGTPWLVGKDVAVALGYKNPGKAIIAHVDEEDKRLEMLPQGADSQNGNVVLYLLCGVLNCCCMGGLIDYVGLWDLYCDLL